MLERVDGRVYGLRQDQGTRGIVHQDDIAVPRNRRQAVARGVLPLGTRRGELDGRRERIRIDGDAAHLIHLRGRAHHDDAAHAGRIVKRLERPRDEGLPGDVDQQFATRVAEARPGTPGDDDRAGADARLCAHSSPLKQDGARSAPSRQSDRF